MIYMDNCATTFPKPLTVRRAVADALANFGANPGRGGHKLSMKANELIYGTRAKLAEFFGSKDVSDVIFCPSCTAALNTVIKGVTKSGDHIIISSLEHNAVLRPVEKLRKIGISYSVAEVVEGDDDKTLSNFRDCINENTRLVVCSAASNVFGIKLPYERICALCRQYGILTCVDAAQSAGVTDIDLSVLPIDFLCVAGHKGLYGPMGTGAFIINCDVIPDSLIEGGTGSASTEAAQPLALPDRFESGTLNLPGIAGLGAGIDFVKNRGVQELYSAEIRMINTLYNSLKSTDKVTLYTDEPIMNKYLPVLSFNIKNRDSEDVARTLNDRYNIAVRAGLHCAPLAHKSKGTQYTGTVRVCPSAFTTMRDIYALAASVRNMQ